MISRLSIPALLVLAVAACATPPATPPPDGAIGGSPTASGSVLEVWTKPGLDTRQFVADEYACYREARDLARTPDLAVGGGADAVRFFVEDGRESLAYTACMTRRGYRRA